MAEEGIQDFIGIMNVTLKGLEDAGKIGLTVTKGGLKLVAKICQLLTWIVRSIKESPYYKTGGKVSMKVLGTKFQDLNYNEFKISNIGERLHALGDPDIDVEKADLLLNQEALTKKIDELCKKYGLIYSRVPNFVANPDTGNEEFRIAFSKSQMEAYTEVTGQLSAYMDKVLKNCGMDNEKEREEFINDVISNSKSLSAALDDIGINAVSTEVFREAMKETYPGYDEKEFAPVEPSDEKKTDYVEIAGNNEYAKEEAVGNVKEITFSKVVSMSKDDQSITIVLEDYPNTIMTINNSDVLDLKMLEDDDSDLVQFKVTLKKDAVYDFEVYHVDPVTKKVDHTKGPEHIRMTLKDFEKMMKENAGKTKVMLTNLLEQKPSLPQIRPGGRKK